MPEQEYVEEGVDEGNIEQEQSEAYMPQLIGTPHGADLLKWQLQTSDLYRELEIKLKKILSTKDAVKLKEDTADQKKTKAEIAKLQDGETD